MTKEAEQLKLLYFGGYTEEPIDWRKRLADEPGVEDDDKDKGLNIAMKDKNGYKFELQFHTDESFDVKMMNHDMYKKRRHILDKTEVDRLGATMRANIAGVLPPEGAPYMRRFWTGPEFRRGK
jgi:hypothetical protein